MTGIATQTRADRERNGAVMKPNQPTTSASDRRLSTVLRIGVAVLVIGTLAFAGLYYKDQYVSAGPTMIDRQTASAEQAVKKTPNNIGARLELASAYQLAKRYDDELTQYDEILKADKNNRFALLGRGGALMAKGDLKGAAVSYHKIADAVKKGEFAGADPQLEEARYYLGSIALKQGDTKEAISQLASALKITRSDSDALYLMGVAQYKSGATKLAVDALKEALLFVPTGWCEPYAQLNLAYTKLGQAPQATYAGGMADFCNKKPAEAKRRLNTLTTGPVKVDALLALGLIAETESSNPEAITWYQKVLKVDRKNASATASLTRLGAGATPGPKSSSTTQGPS
jgi:tetratricopeptide (TPR) repeat protein